MSFEQTSRRSRTSSLAAFGLCLCGALGAALGGAVASPQGEAPGGPGAPPEGVAHPAALSSAPSGDAGPSVGAVTEADWREVRRLVSEDKLQAALELIGSLRQRAREAGDEEPWARALVEETQLGIALHGFSTAVRHLRAEPWPEAPVQRLVLELYYAHALVTYQRAYSWEISQRERVDTSGEVDLEAWTREQIALEAHRAFHRVWEQRQAWGAEPIGTLAEHLEQNSFPPRIRGTLRDAVTYLWVELLADSSLWSPAQSHEVFRLSLAELAEAGTAELGDLPLGKALPHPLETIAHLLADLEEWHAAARRPEAAFEARRYRLERLSGSFSEQADRALLQGALEGALERLGERWEWWSFGMATLAELVRSQDDPWALAAAREIALQGEQAHPGSLGGQRCRHIVASIEAPGYSVTAMTADGPGRRSLLVEHKNLPELWFRAYAVDLAEQVAAARDHDLLPGWRDVQELVSRRRPVTEWRVELPPTPDFRQHRTFVTPPLEAPGLYVVVSSARRDFRSRRNQRTAVRLLVSDLVLLSRLEGDALEVSARSGRTGEALPGARVHLYRYDWRQGHRRVATEQSDRGGVTRFSLDERQAHFLLAEHGGQLALDPGHLYGHRRPPLEERTAALIYTDRAVYRPGQQLLWKVVAYHGGGEESRYRTLPGRSLTVELVDANGEVVAVSTETTNDFGSASGELTIPGGRLLGGWHLRSSLGGSAGVQVEEYKRPTFEVALIDPEEPLRLNRPAALVGEVRYYFGLPVVTGSASWVVTREPVYPWWWGWWHGGAGREHQTIAAGVSALGADGRFTVTFTPEADEREAAGGQVTYRYQVRADVTDEGGETRSASRSYRLGLVAVEARVEVDSGYLPAGEAATLKVRRSDLDGAPRAGEGSWRLVRLEQPEEALLPAEQPNPPPPRADPGTPVRQPGIGGSATPGRYQTPGDLLRPRWDTSVSPQAILRLWPDGPEVAAGALEHGDSGLATLDLPPLPPGAYRLRYQTRDAYGAQFETLHELVVAQQGRTPLALPALLAAERPTVAVGETARILVHSGLAEQPMVLEIFRGGRRSERRLLDSRAGLQVLEIPVGAQDRGGFGVVLTVLRDHQIVQLSQRVAVPWDDRRLEVELATFRDRLRPGARETWRVTLRSADGAALERGAAELLASMYDRSLDLFAPHRPIDPLGLYPDRTATAPLRSTLGSGGAVWREATRFAELPSDPAVRGDRLKVLSGYGIGGLGRGGPMWVGTSHPITFRGGAPRAEALAEGAPAPAEATIDSVSDIPQGAPAPRQLPAPDAPEAADDPTSLRADFAETAFWHPHLLLETDGGVSFEFTVPDSVTEWSFWVQAVTRDLAAGALRERARSVKELMVRPYLPRFLREGDRADLLVVVNNAGENPLTGTLDFDILDGAGEESLLDAFGLSPGEARDLPFSVAPGGGATLSFPVRVPPRLGAVAFRVTARAGGLGDGEQRSLPVLPGRVHLAQSRFAALSGEDRRSLHFADLAAAGDDPTLLHEQLVVTLDAQLFYGVLGALPYLVEFPYECTEQTLNRFVSTGIVSSVFDRYPAVARMAADLSQRETRLEPWREEDPNRRMALVETPWLTAARGVDDGGHALINVLDPRIAAAQRDAAIAQLRKAQTSLGAFPWFPGGPPSPYMTLYLLHGLSKALEFGVEVPRDMVERAWGYMHRHYLDEVVRVAMAKDCCWELVTFLEYVLSSYPDASWTGGVFTEAERRRMRDFSFRHWRRHSPLLKAQLALVLHRAGRVEDARLVFDSVMDSSRTTRDEGTFWAPEERAWLWYNDTVETHAFALRALTELDPGDERRHGLVQWLFLNRKLNHWKSTRATAEVVWALTHYLEREGALGVREAVRVALGPAVREYVFEPEEHTGRGNQWVVPGEEIDPATMATVVVEKETPGFLFASATWHYSTERLPEEASGDLLRVERRYFKRAPSADGWSLQPLADGVPLAAGDQVEVHLSLRARHAAEYVHLQDPRGAGFEPETLTSQHKRHLGIGWYEEVRDSGTHFFFDWLPAGEHTFRYRLRAAMAGTFRVGPATLQSMYAPEFTAYSAGAVLEVGEAGGRGARASAAP